MMWSPYLALAVHTEEMSLLPEIHESDYFSAEEVMHAA